MGTGVAVSRGSRPGMRVLFVLPAIAAVFMSAGCGESEEERIQEVVRQYNRASMDRDADKACALTAAEMFAGTGATCEQVVRINSLPNRRELGQRLATGDYVVTVDGDRATAKGHNLGVFSLKQVDGDWKLTSAR